MTSNVSTGRDDTSPSDKKPVIVAMGASAGGIQALQAFFDALPEPTGAAFVVVLHLDPTRRSEMPKILAARTTMPVIQVENTERLKADHVYVIPPDRQLSLIDHEISATPFEEPRGKRSPIDMFFRSLAERLGDGFAIILSGAGSDGVIGVRAVKESGGIILVQDPNEAEYPSMPRGAIATGLADFVMPVRDIARRLGDLIRLKENGAPADIQDFDEDMLRRILAHLRVRTGHEFSKYKRSTVLRRIGRRMQVTRTENLREYYDVLRDNAEEPEALLRDLLISVTNFFRDPEAFDALAKFAIPEIFKRKNLDDIVRVWIAGCATGEEAYSIAILLLEEAARRDFRPTIQVFGSDLDAQALAAAREGRFTAAIEADISEERLRRYFVREGDNYRVRQEVRDIVLFAMHDVLKDPPFSRVDLISCRNVMIYLDRDLQEHVCSTFHYALLPEGFLFLGTSESADNPENLFRVVDRGSRLLQSTAGVGEKPRLVPRLLGPLRAGEQIIQVGRGMSPSTALSEAAFHRRAIERVAPPSVLVDETHRVVHLSESAGRFIAPSGGPLTGDVVDLVRTEMRFELRSALHRAFEQRESTLSLPIPVRFNGSPHRVHLYVRPAFEEVGERPRSAVVMFIEGEAQESIPFSGEQEGSSDTVRRLAQELELTQSRLRTVREESEAATEELRAVNEELQSINEEYRSTSEELETSKEELQSINEELQTVNSELKLKLEVISRAHSDLQNLVAATDIGTLFLDSTLRIKRFTDRVTDLFSITSNDEGRPITDFAHNLEYGSLVEDARAVLAELSPIRREVRSKAGRWYDTRLRPYRTVDDKIDGVVITFVDVSDHHQVEQSLREIERRQRLLLNELTHRVRNTLAVIQAIARHTLRTDNDRNSLVERFEGRLAALASSHSLLVESEWQGADLEELARHQLEPYASDKIGRVSIEGEPVSLPAELATPFGMVLHELATNATKHGALSSPHGTVALAWTVEERNPQRSLRFSWMETGGPKISSPHPASFGTTLIESAIPGASVKREFHPEGLRCTIDVPLEHAAEEAESGQE